MPAFAYRAATSTGAEKKGLIEATSAAAARGMLREQGLLPLAVDPAVERRSVGSIKLPGLGRSGMSARELATATRQIATLVGSDIPVEEALRLAASQSEAQRVSSILLEVRAAILDGRSFANALGTHPKTFPEFYRASVAAGEASGKLTQVLEHLAHFVENRQANSQKLQLALLYPGLLATVSLGVIVLLLVYVIPDIVKVFVSRGTDLPLLTRMLIAISGFLQAWGLYILFAALVGFVIYGRWVADPANRLKVHRAFTERWPFRRFSRQHNAARFAGSLATLVSSAVPLVEALHAAAAVTPNRWVRERALHVAARVREGISLRAAMTEAGVFPLMLTAIVASGEASGQLGPALSRAADELDRELDAVTSAMVALVEPLVLLLMGGIVLMMVLAILLPIINLNDLVTL